MVTGLGQERKGRRCYSQPGQLHSPISVGKRDPGLQQSLGYPPWGHTSLLAQGCSSPFQPPPVPGPRGKGERKSLQVSPTQDASRAPLQGLSKAGMSQQHLPSPHPDHSSHLPGAPLNPPKCIPGNEIALCSCPEDSPAPGSSTRVPPAPAQLAAEGCSPFLLCED